VDIGASTSCDGGVFEETDLKEPFEDGVGLHTAQTANFSGFTEEARRQLPALLSFTDTAGFCMALTE